MNDPAHQQNVGEFIRRLYAEVDESHTYEPAKPARLDATRRGIQRKIANDRVKQLFDRLTKKKGGL